MPKLKEDKKMSWGKSDFHYSKNFICCKWYDSKPILLQTTNADDKSRVRNVMRRTKDLATKAPSSLLVLTLSGFTTMAWVG